MCHLQYGNVFRGDDSWRGLPVPEGDLYAWDEDSTYVKNPPFFDGMTLTPPGIRPIKGARVLGMFGDSITTDHISPAGSIPASSPAGKWLTEQGLKTGDFNSYGPRRGNPAVSERGPFANDPPRHHRAPATRRGRASRTSAGRRDDRQNGR